MNWFAHHPLVSRLLRQKLIVGLVLPGVLLALLALLLFWPGPGHRVSLLLAGLTQGPRCVSMHTPAACNGQDPIEQGCAAPQQTAVIAAEPIDTDRTAQVRYSTTCQAIWGRIIDSRSGTYAETITIDGTSYHGSPRYVQGYYYTPMKLLPAGQTVHLVVHPATVGRDATISITITGPTSATTPRSTPGPQRTPTPRRVTPPARLKPTPTAPPFHYVSPHQGP